MGNQVSEGEPSQYGSPFPPTSNNDFKYFIDGKDYFYALSEALEQAKSTISILGWCLTPELFLRRPPFNNLQWRLDRTLARATARGVSVYGVIYEDVGFGTIDSSHAVTALEKVNPRKIKIMRHPKHNLLTDPSKWETEFFWSHHEKCIIVDDSIVFFGGLDSCFGRWDYVGHPLVDLHANVRREVWVGVDYKNDRILDLFREGASWRKDILDRTEVPRMPWHDISMSATGPVVEQLIQHFVQRWNFVKKNKYEEDLKYPVLASDYASERSSHASTTSKVDEESSFQAQLVRSVSPWSQGVPLEKSIQEAYIDLILNAQRTFLETLTLSVDFIYIENQFFTTGNNQHPVENLVGKALVDRILKAARAKQPFKVIVIMPAIPGLPANMFTGQETPATKAIMAYQFNSICRGGNSIMECISKEGFNPHDYIRFFNLRAWGEIPLTPEYLAHEREAHEQAIKTDIAYALDIMGLDAFDNGKSIRVSKCALGDELDATVHHVGHAGKESEAVELAKLFNWDEDASDMTKQQKLEQVLTQYPTVDDDDEQFQMLGKESTDRKESTDAASGSVKNFVTEEVYIHAKIMIVDDRVVVCGSANLNDRSQLGDRDSELAVIINQPASYPSSMNNKPWLVSPFAASFRRKLCREHLGLLSSEETVAKVTQNSHPLPIPNAYDWNTKEDILVSDPLSETFWNLLDSTASKNTSIFRDVFHAVPDDQVRTVEEYDSFVTKTKVGHVADYSMSYGHVRDLLLQVKGQIVEMPLHYMEKVDLISKGLNLAVNEFTEIIYT